MVISVFLHPASWGLLGVFIVKIGNGLCMTVYKLLPALVSHIVLLVVLGILAVDAAATLIILFGHSKNPEKWIETEKSLDSVTWKLGAKIDKVVNRRITKAYPRRNSTQRRQKLIQRFSPMDVAFTKLCFCFSLEHFWETLQRQFSAGSQLDTG